MLHVLHMKSAASWQKSLRRLSEVDFGDRIGCYCAKYGDLIKSGASPGS